MYKMLVMTLLCLQRLQHFLRDEKLCQSGLLLDIVAWSRRMDSSFHVYMHLLDQIINEQK